MTEEKGGHNGDGQQLASALQDTASAEPGETLPGGGAKRRGPLDRLVRVLAVVSAVLLTIVLAGVLFFYSGALEGQITSRAQALLQSVAGERFDASIGHSGLRFARRGLVALEVDDVVLGLPQGGDTVVRAENVGITLKLLPLLSGEFQIRRIDVDGGFIDARLLQASLQNMEGQNPFVPFEIDKLGQATDLTLNAVEAMSRLLDERGIRRFRLSETSIAGLRLSGKQTAKETPLKIQSAVLSEHWRTGMTMEADVSFAEQDLKVNAQARQDASNDNRYKLMAKVSGLQSGKLIKEITQNPRRKFRMENRVDVDLTAIRGDKGEPPELTAEVSLSAGDLIMDLVAAQIEPSTIDLAYDPQRKSVEVKKSTVTVADSRYELRGGIIDLDNLPADKNPGAVGKRGFAFDLIVDEAIVAPTDSSEPPVKVAMKAFARLVNEEKRLYVDDAVVSGVSGTMFSSAKITFSDTSPEVSFAANIDQMDMGTIKQLWPYWIARLPRRWVHENLFGGKVTDGKISVFIPRGRMAAALTGGLNLDGQQLQIDFNISDARFDVAGDIPAVRDADGLFSLRGSHLELKINKGASYFPSGRQVSVANGLFVIKQTNVKPLMADLDINVSGDASAVAELISFKPINALQQTPWTAGDFAGPVTSTVKMNFGLVPKQNPPSPEWDATVNLDGVSMGPRVEGMKVTDARGTLHVDTKTIKLDSEARLNGMQATVDFTEPLDQAGGTDSIRVVKLGLTEEDRKQFAPQLNEYIKGTVYLTTKLRPDGGQEIDADLTEAQLILPWIGWSKGKGVKSTARFEMVPSDAGSQVASVEQNSATDASDDGLGLPSAFVIRNFDIKGEGFSAKGDMHFADGDVVKADLSNVSLTRHDSFALSLVKKSGT